MGEMEGSGRDKATPHNFYRILVDSGRKREREGVGVVTWAAERGDAISNIIERVGGVGMERGRGYAGFR